MKKKKPKKRKLKPQTPVQSIRWKQDIDYFEKLPNTAKKYLKKFLEEIYGRKFGTKPLHGKRQQKKIRSEAYAASQDFYHLLVRVPIHSEEARKPAEPKVKEPKKSSGPPEVERIYIENGVTVTRYKPQR
jgi:hypothetical protein